MRCIGLVLSLLLLFSACKKSDDATVSPDNNSNDNNNSGGNNGSVNAPLSVVFYSGRRRALLSWPHASAEVTKAKIFWNNGKDSVVKDVSGGMDTVKVYINDLQEGDYTFDIFVFDKKDNKSDKVLKSGHVYGKVYNEAGKKIENVTYQNDQSLKIDWTAFYNSNATGVQIYYTNEKGTIQTEFADRKAEETTLGNIFVANRGTIKYRTIFAPQGLIMDTLFTGFTTVSYVNRKAVFDSLRGWKFRCKVKAEAQTISDFGGILAFKKNMDEALFKASKKFQVPGLNDAGNHEIHFYMTDISSFKGTSGQFRYIRGVDSADMDLMIIVNAHAGKDDLSWGWIGAPYLTLGHDYKGLFVPNAIDALAHEFGHFRGMYDLYFSNVTAAKNSISGQAYIGKEDMMNSPYGVSAWSEISKVVFNKSADKKVAIKYWTLFSNVFQIKVETSDGNPVQGAKIKLYPVVRHSNSANSVRENDVIMYRGTTDTNGIYDFDGNNPFAIGQDPSNDIFNFLVKITYNGNSVYSWMPLDDALVAGSKDEPYVLEVDLK